MFYECNSRLVPDHAEYPGIDLMEADRSSESLLYTHGKMKLVISNMLKAVCKIFSHKTMQFLKIKSC